jgi:hypothetical protein
LYISDSYVDRIESGVAAGNLSESMFLVRPLISINELDRGGALSVLKKRSFLRLLGQTRREIVILNPAGLADLAEFNS